MPNEHRYQLRFNHDIQGAVDDRHQAEVWLIGMASSRASIYDKQTDESAELMATGEVHWRRYSSATRVRVTRTFAILEVSQAAYDEIAGKLRAAGYAHAFDGATIDMHGIAVVPEA